MQRDTTSDPKAIEAELERLRQRTAELEASETTLLAAIESLPFDFFAIGADGRYTLQNTTCREHWGELIGKTPEEVAPSAETLELWTANNGQAFAGRVVDDEVEVTVLGDTGCYRNIVAPIRGNEGILGILGINIDITEAHRARSKLKASLETLRRAIDGTVSAMASMVEMRDPYTAGHQRVVSDLAGAIAEEMDLPRDRVTAVRLAGAIHDVGKIAIPSEILAKPGALTEIEMDLIRTHPRAGHDILAPIETPWPIADIVLQHHERLDGSGYPLGLHGKAVRLEARILAVADIIEAMASHRPYRPARGIETAIDELLEGSHTLFDEEVVAACVRLLREGRFQIQH